MGLKSPLKFQKFWFWTETEVTIKIRRFVLKPLKSKIQTDRNMAFQNPANFNSKNVLKMCLFSYKKKRCVRILATDNVCRRTDERIEWMLYTANFFAMTKPFPCCHTQRDQHLIRNSLMLTQFVALTVKLESRSRDQRLTF